MKAQSPEAQQANARIATVGLYYSLLLYHVFTGDPKVLSLPQLREAATYFYLICQPTEGWVAS